MKHLPKLIISLLLSILVCIPATFAVFYYTQPMEDVSFDLSLIPEDGQECEGNKGWTVFVYESGEKKILDPDGYGGYLGLTYPGQTFYYSRALTEELDNPTLQIGTANRTFAVFLDDTPIYTDCPELDNRIGSLELPMLDYDRADPITLSLSPDYFEKTLTIAQSTPSVSENPSRDTTVWTSNVQLYCGYAYESSLIAASAKTILPAALLFALELLLLAAFIRNAAAGIFSLRLYVFAIAVLFQICSTLSYAEFFFRYFGVPAIDPTWLFFHLSVGTLLLFLTLYANRLRPLYLTLTLVQWISIALYALSQSGHILEYGDAFIFLGFLPQLSGFFALLLALAGIFFLWNRGSRMFQGMAHAALAVILVYSFFLIISIPFAPNYVLGVLVVLKNDFEELLPNASLKLLWDLCLISSLAAVIADLFRTEADRRSETAVLRAKNELAIESYENLRLQSEEVMMLRHDTMKHYTLLRAMADEAPERMKDYLDGLIGQVEEVRPVVDTRNRLLNILLNGKLNTAAARGITVEIDRTEAPKTLPLTDAEACCLVMNILDNAIAAAAGSDSREHFIRLDLHCKNRLFIFSCENSVSADIKKAPTRQHGYGLKIIRQIMSRWGENMVSIEQTPEIYKITLVIPL